MFKHSIENEKPSASYLAVSTDIVATETGHRRGSERRRAVNTVRPNDDTQAQVGKHTPEPAPLGRQTPVFTL